ncbi:thioesterase [Thalassobacter sp. 16PALIMAR09]|nr:thioesterase [Thalassobacter sp. 16PALIMAR09]
MRVIAGQCQPLPRSDVRRIHKPMDTTDEKSQRVRAFMEALPHCRALGLEMTEIGGGQAVMRMPYNSALVGDPATGVVAGGAVSALMDSCGGAAVMCHPKAVASTATLDLRIDYMRAATPGQAITTRAVCHHITRSVAFVRAEAFDDDASTPVAVANGAFTVEMQS